MAGKWRGYYVYGEGYSDTLFGKKVMFELELHDIGNDEFEGTCTDFDDTTAPPSIIKGYLEEDNLINFLKTHQERSAKANELSISLKPAEICYIGRYNPGQEKFFGEWEHIVQTFSTDEGMFMVGGAGIWNMKKAAD